MKERLKKNLILARNRWGLSNSITRSRESTVNILGNLKDTTIDVQGSATVTIAAGCMIRDATFEIRGSNNRLVLEEGVFFSGKVELFGDGNEFRIGKNSRINGADFTIHNGTAVHIGPRCLFSVMVDIRTTDSHTILNAGGERINPDRDIVIGEHVWIGRMVTVLKGAQIGDGSIVGAMSLVTGKIPGGVIAAGVPAKPIRENVSWK